MIICENVNWRPKCHQSFRKSQCWASLTVKLFCGMYHSLRYPFQLWLIVMHLCVLSFFSPLRAMCNYQSYTITVGQGDSFQLGDKSIRCKSFICTSCLSFRFQTLYLITQTQSNTQLIKGAQIHFTHKHTPPSHTQHRSDFFMYRPACRYEYSAI